MAEAIRIEAPSRLHLGMFSFGSAACRQFGGVGLMVRDPRIQIALRPAPRFSCVGLHVDRSVRICHQVARCWLDGRLPSCEVSVSSAPREHAGLGLGTQLNLAIATGLTRFCHVSPLPTASEMAVRLERARRSSVGMYGFALGGLLIDAGHSADEPVGPLVHRAELPEAWRVVLVTPRAEDGLSGGQEQMAFAELPPVPSEITGRLTAEVLLNMLPAVQSGNFEDFSESVYRFGRMAGGSFAVVQGGPFTKEATTVIERIQSCGTRGAGQSSWGPTVFAFTESEPAARELRERLVQAPALRACDIRISRPDNQGALVKEVSTSV